MLERELPPIQTYEARDGKSLCYRHYLADSNKIVILLHGISVRYGLREARAIKSWTLRALDCPA